jgi:tetratricopeptide (TPR) repeat protein/predicted Ser/Thr protein kinase
LSPVDELPPQIGRYAIIERVGAGGMGLVYRAHDPELDRVVALKIVRPGKRDEEATARLAREARALAQLAHPNVIPVYDVGTVGDQVFVAMEFVEGRTLTKWLVGRPAWREVLAVMDGAGRGLAAAHAAGLIHRDFKPDNVMLSDDGRTRRVLVMDFGLARADPSEPHTTGHSTGQTGQSGSSGPRQSGDSLEVPLTQAGNVMGTPAYMAPEQHDGGIVDARSDQYAFCIALYRALYGERPFASSTYNALVHRKRLGEIDPPPAGSAVPRWVRRVILRGLRPRPRDRWPDMLALLAALDPVGRRRRGVAIGGGLLAVGAASAAWAGDPPPTRPDCASAAQEMAEVWNEGRRTEIRQAFAAHPAPFALPSFERAAVWVDGYAKRWTAIATAACEHEREHAMTRIDDKRRACLRVRRGELVAFVDRLARADDEIVESAVGRAGKLPSLTDCEDEEHLAAAVDPPPVDARAEVEAIQDDLAALHEVVPVTDEHVERAKALVERARKVGYPPILAAALLRRGSLERKRSDLEPAIELITEAYHVAMTFGDDHNAIDAAQLLTFVLGFQAGRYDEAETWAGHGLALLGRSGTPPRKEAALRASIASIYQERGPFEKAEEQYTLVLEIQEGSIGRDHTDYANTLNGLGDVYRRMDRLPEARENLERAIEIYERLVGPDHPFLFTPIGNLAVVTRLQGDLDTAETLLARAVELAKSLFGPDHPNVAMAYGNYANLFNQRGDYARAHEMISRCAEILATSVGDDHPAYAMAIDNDAGFLADMGRYEESRALAARGLDIRIKVLGEDHPEVARSLSNLGRTANYMGDHARARELFARAIGIMEATVGLDHADALLLQNGLATALDGLGETARAREVRRRLLERCDRTGATHVACDDTRAALEP